MIDTKHLRWVAVKWMSIVYVVCYAGVAIYPPIRPWFMKYALHTIVDVGQNITTFGTFISGLIIWDIVAVAAFWLFAVLYNKSCCKTNSEQK